VQPAICSRAENVKKAGRLVSHGGLLHCFGITKTQMGTPLKTSIATGALGVAGKIMAPRQRIKPGFATRCFLSRMVRRRAILPRNHFKTMGFFA
jgi:hypothetical protein